MRKTILNLLDNIERFMLIVLFTILMGFMIFGIVSRYGFGTTVAWIEQMTRLLFVWISFTGVSYAALKRGHLKVEALSSFTKESIGRSIIFIGDVLTTIFVLYLSYRVAILTINVHQKGQTFSAMPWMPISMLYLSGVLGLAGMAIRTIQKGILPFLLRKSTGDDEIQKEVN